MTYVDDLAAAIRAETSTEDLPSDEGRLDELFRLYALLGLVKGQNVSASDVHDAWAVWMIDRGEADHESVVPFGELSAEVKSEDEPFVAAIRRALGR